MRGHLLTVIGTLVFGIAFSGLISFYIHYTKLVDSGAPEADKVKVSA